MEKKNTKQKNKALYLLWFYSQTFPGARHCSCPRRVQRPREEPAPGTALLSPGSHRRPRESVQGTDCLWWSSFVFMQTRWLQLVIICCWHPSAAKKPQPTSLSCCSRRCRFVQPEAVPARQEVGTEKGTALLKVTEQKENQHPEPCKGSRQFVEQPLIPVLSQNLSRPNLLRMWATAF